MSLAIQWGTPTTSNIEDQSLESGFIYFDAVTSFTTAYKGSVTKHPIDGGGNITDHFIRDNPQFTLSVVISPYDISTNSYLITDLEDTTPYNVREAPTAVSVSSDDNMFKKFIPDSIGQWLTDELPEVTVDGARTDYTEQIKDLLSGLIQRKQYNEKTGQFENIVQHVSLYEYFGLQLKRITSNLVVTAITFKEDANTGSALYAELSIEQVEYATIRKTVIPADVADILKNKTKPNEGKGKQDSTPKTETPAGSGSTPAADQPKKTPEDIDPERGAADAL